MKYYEKVTVIHLQISEAGEKFHVHHISIP